MPNKTLVALGAMRSSSNVKGCGKSPGWAGQKWGSSLGFLAIPALSQRQEQCLGVLAADGGGECGGVGWGGALRGSGRRAGKGTLWALILLHAFYTYKPILHPVRWLGRGLWKHTDESWSPVTCQSPDFITLLT